jgi:hypothetical protein
VKVAESRWLEEGRCSQYRANKYESIRQDPEPSAKRDENATGGAPRARRARSTLVTNQRRGARQPSATVAIDPNSTNAIHIEGAASRNRLCPQETTAKQRARHPSQQRKLLTSAIVQSRCNTDTGAVLRRRIVVGLSHIGREAGWVRGAGRRVEDR